MNRVLRMAPSRYTHACSCKAHRIYSLPMGTARYSGNLGVYSSRHTRLRTICYPASILTSTMFTNLPWNQQLKYYSNAYSQKSCHAYGPKPKLLKEYSVMVAVQVMVCLVWCARWQALKIFVTIVVVEWLLSTFLQKTHIVCWLRALPTQGRRHCCISYLHAVSRQGIKSILKTHILANRFAVTMLYLLILQQIAL